MQKHRQSVLSERQTPPARAVTIRKPTQAKPTQTRSVEVRQAQIHPAQSPHPTQSPPVHAATSVKDLWLTSISFGMFIFINVCFYYFLTGDVLSLEMINKATATTAIVVMGASFALSGFGYFWDFLDKKVMYRKYLGLTGYFFVVWHALNSLYFYFFSGSQLKKFDLYNTWDVFGISISNLIAFFLGLTALAVFTFMALISNKYATKRFGLWWRKLLRLGYFALILALLHFSIKNFSLWVIWFKGGFVELPPMSLILSVYVLFVLGLRIWLAISLMRKNKSKGEHSPRIPENKPITK